MILKLPMRTVEVFTISPPTLDERLYRDNIVNHIRWSERYGCTGILIFTGNDCFVDPWLWAQIVCSETDRLCPLVAVNPVYMHPFSAAKMVSSLAYLYGRRTYLNMVTGSVKSYLESLDDRLAHDQRYDRLLEYCLLLRSLVCEKAPASFDGAYYKVRTLQLLPNMEPELWPGFVISGQSEAARRIAAATGGVAMRHLQPDLGNVAGGELEGAGIYLGIVARDSEAAAWKAARGLFPADEVGEAIFDYSVSQTESVWKKRLAAVAGDPAAAHEPGYWLQPFRSHQTDCPYFVGTYDQAAAIVERHVRKGVSTFILDIVPREEEFHHVAEVFARAGARLESLIRSES